MAFTRLAIMTPKRGNEARVEEMLNDLLKFQSEQPGFVAGYLLRHDPHESGTTRIGRFTVWESEEHANHVAQQQHDMSLQSELKLQVDDETHEEHSFLATAV